MNKVLPFIVNHKRKLDVFLGSDLLLGTFNFDWGKRSLYECETFYILIYVLKQLSIIH